MLPHLRAGHLNAVESGSFCVKMHKQTTPPPGSLARALGVSAAPEFKQVLSFASPVQVSCIFFGYFESETRNNPLLMAAGTLSLLPHMMYRRVLGDTPRAIYRAVCALVLRFHQRAESAEVPTIERERRRPTHLSQHLSRNAPAAGAQVTCAGQMWNWLYWCRPTLLTCSEQTASESLFISAGSVVSEIG